MGTDIRIYRNECGIFKELYIRSCVVAQEEAQIGSAGPRLVELSYLSASLLPFATHFLEFKGHEESVWV